MDDAETPPDGAAVLEYNNALRQREVGLMRFRRVLVSVVLAILLVSVFGALFFGVAILFLVQSMNTSYDAAELNATFVDEGVPLGQAQLIRTRKETTFFSEWTGYAKYDASDWHAPRWEAIEVSLADAGWTSAGSSFVDGPYWWNPAGTAYDKQHKAALQTVRLDREAGVVWAKHH